jgi:hypothetical protein
MLLQDWRTHYPAQSAETPQKTCQAVFFCSMKVEEVLGNEISFQTLSCLHANPPPMKKQLIFWTWLNPKLMFYWW